MSHQSARTNMIKQQLRTGDVLDENVLNLYYQIPRHDFVPEHFAHFAYSDMQIPLGSDQRMLTPLEEGKILQALKLTGVETVLEVGTGSGFFTALLSKLCKHLISIDCDPRFIAEAASKLHRHQCNNLELIHGDACRGWLDQAPYDVIIYTGALEKLNEIQKLQLLPGGKLFVIEGTLPVMQARMYQLDHKERWQETLIFETSIPLLIDKSRPKEFIF